MVQLLRPCTPNAGTQVCRLARRLDLACHNKDPASSSGRAHMPQLRPGAVKFKKKNSSLRKTMAEKWTDVLVNTHCMRDKV